MDVRDWWRLIAAAVVAVNAMTISLAINSSSATPSTRLAVNMVLLGMATACAALVGGELARNGLAALRRRRVSVEAMFAAGITGALVASVVAALTGRGHTYFEVIAILLVVYAFGRKLGAAAEQKALAAAREWAPEITTCRVLDGNGSEREIPVAELAAGMRVVVNPGETIPADGVVVAGEALVREAEMTGEGFAVARRAGDRVWAATHCLDARLVIRAATDGRHRRIDGIVAAVERARSTPSGLQRQADRVVAWFLPAVLLVAAGTFAAWTAAAGVERGLFNAMAVLLVACPCALGLATPLAVWGAIARLASRGMVVRGGDTVEALAHVDTAIFDKTGTLTGPEAILVDLVCAPPAGMTEAGLRRAIQAVQRAGRHPVAAAFRDLEPEDGGLRVEALRLLPGVGVAARVAAGEGGCFEIEIGRWERLAPPGNPRWAELSSRLRCPPGSRLVAVRLDGEIVAAAAVDEHLLESWPAALAGFRELGVEVRILTGDRRERARQVAADAVLAELSPEEKLAEVGRLRAEGRRVVFVGDGVNDAAAMAAGDVGVAVAAGAPLAGEVADVTWASRDLEVLPWAVRLARRTLGTIRGNLAFALAYNIAGIGLATAGLLHPVAAAILMTCSSLIVTWRATTVLGEEQEEAVAAALAPAGEAG